ncbi:MAG: acyl carrier protein [Clostridia bacterium]|nr:acyl carrier protein [Clostridia bacterium]
MSNQNNIIERLTELFNSVFEGELKVDSLTEETRLIEDIGMNSIGLLYMAMAVEEEFGVRFTNEDFVSLRTIGDVVKKIEANI